MRTYPWTNRVFHTPEGDRMESRVSPRSTGRRVTGVKPVWVLVGVLGVLAAATLLLTSQAQAAPPRIEGAT